MSSHGPEGLLDIAPEVASALEARKPVVALETTIVAHGMPYPQNVEAARRAEAAVRAEGATPATIAVLGGRVRVGLDDASLERLGCDGQNVAKVSRHDLPAVVAAGADGATTVAAAMIVARLAGIRVFVTGGIGGVQRGGELTMDISADLQELARTSVAVVCAGAKTILDLGRTLEVLETLGVPVVGFGTDELPAFFCRTSGLRVPIRVDTPAAVAALLSAKWQLGLDGGVVVAVPIPEEHALSSELVEGAIADGLAAAEAQGVRGKGLTPFLLSRVAASTAGRSLAANIALVENNARVGARIALACAALD